MKAKFKELKEQKGNLVLSLDVTRSQDLLKWADLLGPHIAILKTHIDILEDYSKEVIFRLKELRKKHNFLLFEDRKFADIGSTVEKQYSYGPFRIREWADIVNMHPLPGKGCLEGLIQANPKVQILLVAEMSSQGNLIDSKYTESAVRLAEEYADYVVGFVAQRKLSPNFLTFTPGIHLEKRSDSLGQRYRTPEEAFNEGIDFIIVGRAITHSQDPAEEAKKYSQRVLCNK